MIEQLFGSKTRVKLLQLFLSSPDRAYYVREITRKIDEQINSVRRELANLLTIGIITSDTSNNKLYYKANQEYHYFPPLKDIFGGPSEAQEAIAEDIATTTPTGDTELAVRIHKLGNVELALLTGIFTREDRAQVDVLMVGDLNSVQTAKFITELEKEERRELRFSVLSVSDWKYRQQIKDKFALDIIGSKNIVIIDKNNQLKEN